MFSVRRPHLSWMTKILVLSCLIEGLKYLVALCFNFKLVKVMVLHLCSLLLALVMMDLNRLGNGTKTIWIPTIL